MNQNIPASTNNTMLKPLKYPGLGLFMSFKIFLEILMYILQCALRGFLFVFKDLPITAWQQASGKVDAAYKGTKKVLEKKDDTEKKKSLLIIFL